MNRVVMSSRLPRRRGAAPITVVVNGEPIQAYPGETVATVLLALGRQDFRHTEGQHSPRGLFCGMGICFDCLVTVDGEPNVRACVTMIRAGMVVQTGGPSDA
jgi:aerobic-type carbon monoxide dehydrogenase small subunit (CoxS/CutS family)